MKHQFYGEKRQRFSLRKLSVGLISATIGGFFLVLQLGLVQTLLKQIDEAKMKWFRKIENYYITDKYGKQTHAGNQTRTFTAEEIKKLKTFESLIDHDVITRRENKDSGKYGRNGYLSLSLFSPIYSALSNPTGAPGDVMFRRTAYELLAAKGYHEGFVPYVSGKFSEEALKEGSTTWDGWFGKDVGLVTDQKVLENVFKGEYNSWVAFKKAMYQERIDQLTKLKPITIEYELRNPNSAKQVTIRSYKDMQRLMDEALAESTYLRKRFIMLIFVQQMTSVSLSLPNKLQCYIKKLHYPQV